MLDMRSGGRRKVQGMHSRACRPGATEAELDAAAEALGTPLPAALRVLYRFVNGQELLMDQVRGVAPHFAICSRHNHCSCESLCECVSVSMIVPSWLRSL